MLYILNSLDINTVFIGHKYRLNHTWSVAMAKKIHHESRRRHKKSQDFHLG